MEKARHGWADLPMVRRNDSHAGVPSGSTSMPRISAGIVLRIRTLFLSFCNARATRNVERETCSLYIVVLAVRRMLRIAEWAIDFAMTVS